MSITGGIIRGKAVAGYNPTMQTFNGTDAYYSKTSVTTSGAALTFVCRFKAESFTGDVVKRICNVPGPSPGYEQCGVFAISSNHSTLTNRQGCIQFYVRNSANSDICLLLSEAGFLDGKAHTLFASFDGSTGVATYYIDGQSADDTGNADRVAPTTGTLDAGTSTFGFGATAGGASFWNGSLGFIGFRNAYLTNWSDFMGAHGNPKQINESTWAEWGAQPLFWHDEGIMTLNKGSAGAMTANGTITTAAASTAFMGLKNGIVGPVARGITRKQEQASGFDAYLESLSPAVWYKFDDTSFATTINDYGSAGADLTSQNSTDASAGTPMRITRSKSLAMPAATTNNWATEGAHYTDSGAIVASLWSGLTAFTIVHSIRVSATSHNDDIYLFRLGTNQTLQSAAGFRAMMSNPTISGALKCQERHTTLGYTAPETTSTGLDDGTPHFVVYRWGPSGYNATLDGTQELTNGSWGYTTTTVSPAFNVGGTELSTDGVPAWQSDCFAFWPSYLTDEQVAALSTKYLAEIA